MANVVILRHVADTFLFVILWNFLTVGLFIVLRDIAAALFLIILRHLFITTRFFVVALDILPARFGVIVEN